LKTNQITAVKKPVIINKVSLLKNGIISVGVSKIKTTHSLLLFWSVYITIY